MQTNAKKTWTKFCEGTKQNCLINTHRKIGRDFITEQHYFAT